MDPTDSRYAAQAGPSSSGQKARTMQRATRTHRGLTCANCRARKTRCDGGQPRCKTCDVYRDECRYDKLPPMTQILAMAKRLQTAEETIVDLRKALEERSPGQAGPSGSGDMTGWSPTQRSPARMTLADRSLESRRIYSTSQSRNSSREPGAEDMISDLSLDENGKICYIGPTSAVHDPPSLPLSRSPSQSVEDESSPDTRTWLAANAEELRAWEQFAVGSASEQTDIPREALAKLLQIHWSWTAPMFMWVYRPTFMRDMGAGGPYCTPLLITTLCAHAARFDPGHTGDMRISKARLLLGAEIHKPSAIPTVQALLQLSAHDLAHGSISQSWLYSGMAFRMASDLGLHHSGGKNVSIGNLTPEDLEIRRRLFWSCYFWDKAVSLYLGRMPVLTELPPSQTPDFLDDYAENEVWSPYVGDSLNLSLLPPGQYPQTPAHSISCFENSCKLAVIINDIILQLYSKRIASDAEEGLRSTKEALDQWREATPGHLKCDPQDLPPVCPPPHILTQNLLFYTTVILLHRPFFSEPAHHAACRSASESIEKLLLLLEKTFGFTRITYLIAYCIYTGASVLVHDVKQDDIEARLQMQTFLRAVKQGIQSCPLLQRSLDIIAQSLAQGPASAAAVKTEDEIATVSAASHNCLPAFPYVELPPEFPNQPDGQWSQEAEGGVSPLDSFPEHHLDNVTGEWYMPQ